jgi:hypothetical protein
VVDYSRLICDGVERFCEVGWRGFVSSGGPSFSGFAACFHFFSCLPTEADILR